MTGIMALALVAGLYGISQYLSWRVEQQFPPTGAFVEVDGVRLHFVDMPAGEDADLPPIVFVHGASGNARDLMGAFAPALEGRARLVFVDRPGAGYSQRGAADAANPETQARLIAGLLGEIGIDKAIIVGHSLGGAITAAFALNHGDRAHGLVFVAPATHPWPGGDVTWYYDIANFPVAGRLFSELLAVPLGNLLYRQSAKAVFKPEKMPADYPQLSATRLVLRPDNFRHNAADVGGLYANVARMAERYGEIDLPTVVITGDSDDVVLADIHSVGLERDIAGARLVWLDRGGHMPSYTRTGEIVAQIEALSAETAGGQFAANR